MKLTRAEHGKLKGQPSVAAQKGEAEPSYLQAKFLEDRVVVVDFERCAEVEEYIGTVCAGIRGKSSSLTTHAERATMFMVVYTPSLISH